MDPIAQLFSNSNVNTLRSGVKIAGSDKMQNQPELWMHSALTLVAPESEILDLKPDPTVIGGFSPVRLKKGQDKELCQFAAAFPRYPLPEFVFRKAFREMEESCLAKAKAAGLIKA